MMGLPEFLHAIYTECHANGQRVTNMPEVMANWFGYINKAKENLPSLTVDGNGHSVHLGPLSPGCVACQEGTWDCIFLTGRCNLHCSFCYSPLNARAEGTFSAFGVTREEIKTNYTKARIEGISFSGGEPFLVPDQLESWIGWARSLDPQKYLWLYTNGSLVQQGELDRLADLGLDEIRFNVAATGYTDPHVLKMIEYAVPRFPSVTIEIPAIPAHAPKILENFSIWAKIGVKYLNLHELLYEPGTPSEGMIGKREGICLQDGHLTAIDPDSRELILAVMEQADRIGSTLAINNCSLVNKLHQIDGRRASLLPLTQAPYERSSGELLECYVLIHENGEFSFCHPDKLEASFSQRADTRLVKIARTAPLSIHDPGKWVVWEEQDRA